jgi:hypothetical protein
LNTGDRSAARAPFVKSCLRPSFRNTYKLDTLMKACEILSVRQWMSRSRVLLPMLQEVRCGPVNPPHT